MTTAIAINVVCLIGQVAFLPAFIVRKRYFLILWCVIWIAYGIRNLRQLGAL